VALSLTDRGQKNKTAGTSTASTVNFQQRWPDRG